MNRTREIIVVDDDRGYLESFCGLAREVLELEPIGFDKPSDAIQHIQSRKTAPLASFVDMKPYDLGLLKKTTTKEDLPELEMPEQIHTLLRERGWLRNFYFITAHVSEYDSQVLVRTGADYLEKDSRTIGDKLRQIAREA